MGFEKGVRKNRLYPTGEDHPRWQGGVRSKTCQYCGVVFHQRKTEPLSTFNKRKFCCKPCADKGGFRYKGKDNVLYREEARRRNRGGSHRKWVNAVMSRDKATCQKCGATEIELHAHHIKPFKDYPELRFNVANGLTLCYSCHWKEHTALNEKAVNSVDIRKDNTEPSFHGNVIEGVTTRGRAYRRWVGLCSWCDKFISKPLSDIKGKAALFCSGSCRSKWIRAKHGPISKAVISSKSAAPERDDIV